MAQDLTLYGAPLSPFYERVVLLLALKGEDDAVAKPGIPGGSLASAEYRKINPVGKIPALSVGDEILVESRAILAFLDRRFPDPALMPTDPLTAGRAEMLAELGDNYVMPNLGAFFRLSAQGIFTGEQVDQAKAALLKSLDDLEHFFATDPFAVADQWTRADVVLLPILFFVAAMDAIYKYGGFEGREKLAGWYARIIQTPEGAASIERLQTALDAYRASKA